MAEQSVIQFTDVSKEYALGQRGYRTLREDISKLFDLKGRKRNNRFSALKNISFRVEKGEVLGIIGPNGAGKSTVLKLLAGITLPSEGKIYKKGRIAAMIELAAGFHPELSGSENIYLYGSIMGMKRTEIKSKFKQIVDFSEVGEFIDTPLKRYSSGMKARLGFAVSSHIDADILLIDEVLSVGDMSFQKKCLSKMQEYLNSNRAVVFVSHNLNSIRRLCRRTILLDTGSILYDGPTEEAINKYSISVSENKTGRRSNAVVNCSPQSVAEVKEVNLFNAQGKPSSHFNSGERAVFRYTAKFYQNAENADFGFFIRRDDRLIIFDTSRYRLKQSCVCVKANANVNVEFKFHVDLLRGNYFIGTYIADLIGGVKHTYFDYVDNAVSFFVDETISYAGVANLRAEVNLTESLQ